MGNNFAMKKVSPEWLPEPLSEPTFDPNFGFEKPRKVREMIATEEEMRAAQLPLDRRDYCAHKLINYQACKKQYWPWVVMCKPEKHEYLDCEFDDFVLRMKEYEREKRLRQRKLRLEGQ